MLIWKCLLLNSKKNGEIEMKTKEKAEKEIFLHNTSLKLRNKKEQKKTLNNSFLMGASKK